MADINDLEVFLTVKVRLPDRDAHRLATMQSGFTPDDYRSHAAEIIADSVTKGILDADVIKTTNNTVEINREASL